ncbi:hypothetical protein KDAU_66190 [Dictyobacter aurantiacus]|uniref:WYL domain-containing protein n=2 Tax=Dictyobacter aurantiacus TaxID=1936993 RepID=A0A401ZR72_9CHLR|nr:hypothetical protein KDAU_66190 [Dictyobacter aurantiacus]
MEANDAPQLSWDELDDDSSSPRHETAERLLRLVLLLTGNTCTRKEVFAQLGSHYKIDENDEEEASNARYLANQLFGNDIAFLEEIGYEIEKTRSSIDRRIYHYHIAPGSGPGTQFLFRHEEVEALIVVYALFTDPSKYASISGHQIHPSQPPRHPFSEEVLALIERFVEMLPVEQRHMFDQSVRKPYIYFNMAPVTDYLPHRTIINTLADIIASNQSVSFHYTSSRGKKHPTFHQRVDPYYIIHLDGHFYLIGYSYKMNCFFEFRIDRILADTLKPGSEPIDRTRQQRPIAFSYWADEDLAHSGLSQRWLRQSIEQEEEYADEYGRLRRRFLIRAYAYSEWRILQQLRKYASKVELVEPRHLREQMRDDLQRTLKRYL